QSTGALVERGRDGEAVADAPQRPLLLEECSELPVLDAHDLIAGELRLERYGRLRTRAERCGCPRQVCLPAAALDVEQLGNRGRPRLARQELCERQARVEGALGRMRLEPCSHRAPKLREPLRRVRVPVG